MGFQKFNKAEKAEVLSPQAHKAVEDELKKVGKTSAKDLSDAERRQVDGLDKR